MGTITRDISISSAPDEALIYIGYSQYLVGNPLSFYSVTAGQKGCPMIQGNYQNSEENIEGSSPNNVCGNNGDGFWEITFNANSWSINSVGGVRVGDILGHALITTPATFAYIIKVIKTATTLTIVVNGQGTSGTNVNNVTLFPVGRGNFGPAKITVTNAQTSEQTIVEYQPPTTQTLNDVSYNYFVVDATEALKVAMAKNTDPPTTTNLSGYRYTVRISIYLDGTEIDYWQTSNALCGLDLPYGSPNQLGMTSLPATSGFTDVKWNIKGYPDFVVAVTTYNVTTKAINTLGYYSNTALNCTDPNYEFLSIDANYLGLAWLNNFGGWDVFFFAYGEGGQYGGNAPVHNYNSGKSIQARKDFDITQVSRGVQTQSWSFNSGMMPVEWVPFFQGLMSSNLIYAIPPNVELAISGSNPPHFDLNDQSGMIRVYLEDADWEDSVFGEPKTRFSGTVTVAKILKGRLL